MKKNILRGIWEVLIVVTALLMLAMIGDPTGSVEQKESAYSVFMFYGFVSYFITRGRWLFKKYKTLRRPQSLAE